MAAAYSEADKAIAREIVARYGGEVTQEALETIRQALAAPTLNRSTVHRWMQSQPVASELHPVKKEQVEQALDDYFEQVARKMLLKALEADVIGDMRGKDLVMAAAIAVDKMRLLRDMPTEIISIWPGLMQALKDLELNPADVFNALIAQAQVERAKRDH